MVNTRTVLGNLMILLGVIAFNGVVWDYLVPWAPVTPFGSLEAFNSSRLANVYAPSRMSGASGHDAGDVGDVGEITRIRIPRLEIDSSVTLARYQAVDQVRTWAVPDDQVGYAEHTGSVGKPGNVVLFGHVIRRGLPGVFSRLHDARERDVIDVSTARGSYRYRVMALGSVAATDDTVLADTEQPILTLVTCDGVWLPRIWDYTHRLVVIASLESSP
jgi:LPXTG-site transpeptidase (sortase) family protein